MGANLILFRFVFEDEVTRAKCLEVDFGGVTDVVIRVASLDFTHLEESPLELVIDLFLMQAILQRAHMLHI